MSDKELREFAFEEAIKQANDRNFDVERVDDYLLLHIKDKAYKVFFYKKNKTLVLHYDEEREFEFQDMTDLIDSILIR